MDKMDPTDPILCHNFSSSKWGSRKEYKMPKRSKVGGPLSPLLFVLVTDLLQCNINKAHQQGPLQLPIPSRDEAGFPIIQYVNDTILVMRVSQR
jgi:hypothetical protein